MLKRDPLPTCDWYLIYSDRPRLSRLDRAQRLQSSGRSKTGFFALVPGSEGIYLVVYLLLHTNVTSSISVKDELTKQLLLEGATALTYSSFVRYRYL